MGGGIGVIRAVQSSAILSFVAQAFQYDADLVFREKCRCRVARRIFALLGLPDTTRHSQTGSHNPADTRRKQTGHRNPRHWQVTAGPANARCHQDRALYDQPARLGLVSWWSRLL